jgi:hypothetical protein
MAAVGLSASLTPAAALACACGCGVFDVGSGTFLPSLAPSGFTAWFTYNDMNQDRNWEGVSAAPAADNRDKQVRTDFFTLGGSYSFNRNWSLSVNLPIYDRWLTSTDDGTVQGPAGSIYTAHDTAIGDIQVMATYAGFAPDQSTGLSFGLKLPTGDDTGPTGRLGGAAFDRDTLPGTGSTDLLLGAYHVGYLGAARRLSWFVQSRYDVAFATRDQYRPGNEMDSALGVSYDLGAHGPLADLSVFAQALNSWRLHDTGANADPLNSGDERILMGPGVSIRIQRLTLTGDVELPVYQDTRSAPRVSIEGTSGQLVAPQLVTLQAAYDF